MSLANAPEGFGWFSYGTSADVPPRNPHDPPIVVWRKGDRRFVIDDGNRHVDLSGLAESEATAGLYLAQAMGWLEPGTPVLVKDPPALLRSRAAPPTARPGPPPRR